MFVLSQVAGQNCIKAFGFDLMLELMSLLCIIILEKYCIRMDITSITIRISISCPHFNYSNMGSSSVNSVRETHTPVRKCKWWHGYIGVRSLIWSGSHFRFQRPFFLDLVEGLHDKVRHVGVKIYPKLRNSISESLRDTNRDLLDVKTDQLLD